MKNSARWMWHALHVVVGLALPFVLVFVSGCMKAKPKREDLGPPVPSNKITEALLGASEGATLDDLAVGQYLTFALTRRVENAGSMILLGARKIEVMNLKVVDDENRFTLRIINDTRKEDGTFDRMVTEESLWLRKVSVANLVKTAEASEGRSSFHNLRESNGVLPPPQAVRERPGCGGLNPCEIPVHYVQFDLVLWNNETDYQKISIDFAFAYKTPYIPYGKDFDQLPIVVDCRATYIPVNDRTVYVRDCLTLDDFQK